MLVLAAACYTEVAAPSASAMPSLSVTGEGRVSAPADTAVLDVGVSLVRDTVAEARDAAAAAMTRLRDSLEANGVTEDEITTTQFNVFPEFDFREDQQTIRGFRVINIVSARVTDIADAASVIDAAILATGDDVTVNGIRFTIDDPEPLLVEARALAVADANARAAELAGLADVAVGDLLTISESGGAQPIPFAFAESAAVDIGGGGPTPIDGGELTISVSVFAVFAIE
jgi:hypothetical protein